RENHPRRTALVERIKMDARRAALEELDALHGGVCDAKLEDGVGVVLIALELQAQPHRNRRAAEAREALDLLEAGDRHDAGDDGHANARRLRPLHEVEVKGVVEK